MGMISNYVPFVYPFEIMKLVLFLLVCLFSLCVIGLAPTHIAFKDEGGITNIDFNVGKSDRSVLKVSGKRKKVAFSLFIALPQSNCYYSLKLCLHFLD